MHLEFSFNSNNLNAQEGSTKLHNLNSGIMYRGLHVVTSIESVDFDSSESEFGASVNSTTLAWASELFPSGSWINSYVPSTSGVISIWHAIVGKIRYYTWVYLSFTIKLWIQSIKQSRWSMLSTLTTQNNMEKGFWNNL